ncbi:MAG: hypothetical protein AB7G11_13115 [Phycisphaerales bacterium]
MRCSIFTPVCASLTLGLSAALLSGALPASLPGPPMICQPFDIGNSSSIGDVSMNRYDSKKLIADTLEVLSPKAPTLVRMETLRRATVAVASDPAMAKELTLRLTSRVLDADASGKSSAQAWFDAGYLAASLSEMGVNLGYKPGLDNGCEGYAWLKKAAALNDKDAGIEFACALATHPAMHKGTHETYRSHLARAASLASGDALANKNIQAHCKNWDVKLDDLKARAGSNK